MTSQKIVVAGAPLGPDDVLTHEALCSRTVMLGDGSGSRLVREGGVSFGRPVVERLSPQDYPILRGRDDGHVFVLVRFPFDLDRVTGSRRYLSAEFTVELADENAIAHSMWPMLVRTEDDIDRAREFAVANDLTLTSLRSSPSGRPTRAVIRYAELEPTIRAFGGGRSTFSWTLEPGAGQSLEPAGRNVFAVLELPTDTTSVIGLLSAHAEIVRHTAGEMEPVTTETRLVPFTRKLSAVISETTSPEQTADEVDTAGDPVSVFISYAYEEDDHARQVARLAELLAREGCHVRFDQWSSDEARDWYAWIIDGISRSDYTILVASPTYARIGDGIDPPGRRRHLSRRPPQIRT